MSIAKTITGAKLKLFINNQIFGVATGIEYTIDSGRKAIFGIDKMTPFELAPTQCTIKGSIKCVRIHFDGGLEGRGISAPESKILSEKYISIKLVDRLTDRVILSIDRAAVGRQNWEAENKGLFSGSFDFEGLTWVGEADIG